MILTPRLLKIAEFVSYDTVADIGTDHAKLPIYLMEKKICRYAIASDVADGPVSACKKSVAIYGFSEKIDIRKGDGLKTLSVGEVDTIVIAGMGGDLISHILKDSEEVCNSAKEIILQPMTHIIGLRKYLKQNSFRIIDEVLVKEKDKIYTVLKVSKGENVYQKEIDYIVSPLFIKNKDALLGEYISKMILKYKKEFDGLKCSQSANETALSELEFLIDELEKIYETAKNY